ncbi:DUF2498 family protein [Photorhabdus temperata]|uniref:Uncharacterized protein n=2 Tax=Photorhabdus temperata TaxID=574560 RepID=A0A081S1H0_PHOTE|nr:DUF2498 family protein [Photorhabdus temperata]EQB98990.1 hypothetical protein B738_20888 [Photorhabdus temperata subsp. temperata M1021]ERT12211.1 hypothetical protein O185_15665 [Photorhabdus temperata J3]KER04773.1 Protein of unknown function (DUF2498) [Photorhabdus temperata subsp. temperata Meg1]MCT8346581.1 DUF2498 family protein [Photorhabdus temperata]
MRKGTAPIKREQLLEKANRIIHQHKDFIQGMHVDDVAQKGDVLAFRGESFLDEKKRTGRYIKTL